MTNLETLVTECRLRGIKDVIGGDPELKRRMTALLKHALNLNSGVAENHKTWACQQTLNELLPLGGDFFWFVGIVRQRTDLGGRNFATLLVSINEGGQRPHFLGETTVEVTY